MGKYTTRVTTTDYNDNTRTLANVTTHELETAREVANGWHKTITASGGTLSDLVTTEIVKVAFYRTNGGTACIRLGRHAN